MDAVESTLDEGAPCEGGGMSASWLINYQLNGANLITKVSVYYPGFCITTCWKSNQSSARLMDSYERSS